jgi:colanic acid/amylovoran biosynthesis glycosyltransferase
MTPSITAEDQTALTSDEARRYPAGLRLAYLTSRYPAVSHTFIFREIAALRLLGVTVEASSVNPPDRPTNQLPECEQVEEARVFYIKRTPVHRIVTAHLRTLITRPLALLRGLGLILSHAGTNIKQLGRWVGYLAEAVIVGDWLRRSGCRHLHVHFATEVANVGYLAAKIFGIDLTLTVHGPDEFYDVTRHALAKKIEAASLVCCISYFTRGQLMKLTAPDQWHKFHVVRLGVDIREFTPQPFRPLPETFEVLCVGRLVPAKGQHILLRSMLELSTLGYNVRLRLVGDGPDRESLERYCREHGLEAQVCFEGAVNQDRVRDYFRSADLFVLASFAEGIPVVLMEAMASEVACISTSITGIPELIRNGIDGVLVPSSDEHSLTKAIVTLIDNPDLRRRLGKAGRARVADEFEMNKNVATLRSLFCDHAAAEHLVASQLQANA